MVQELSWTGKAAVPDGIELSPSLYVETLTGSVNVLEIRIFRR